MDLKPIMSKEFVLDYEAIRLNKEAKALAQTFISEESSNFKIYSYKAIELRHEIVDQSNIIENSLAIANCETKIKFDEIICSIFANIYQDHFVSCGTNQTASKLQSCAK